MSEKSEDRKRRLARERKRKQRLEATEEERCSELDKQRKRMRQKRDNEASPRRSSRLQQMRERAENRLQQESPESRLHMQYPRCTIQLYSILFTLEFFVICMQPYILVYSSYSSFCFCSIVLATYPYHRQHRLTDLRERAQQRLLQETNQERLVHAV